MDELRLYVTGADIRAARADWERARDTGDAPERVERLRRQMEALWRVQAQQFREEFRQSV